MRTFAFLPPCTATLRRRSPASWEQPLARRSPAQLISRASSGRATESDDFVDDSEQAHVPVLMEQILSFFRDRKLSVYVDATLGAGGHASAVLREHPELETFVGIDQDPTAHSLAARARPRDRSVQSKSSKSNSARQAERVRSSAAASTSVHLVRSNFRNYASALRGVSPALAQGGVSAALFDLGMSSMQVDTAERGFSFLREGPLDMRMDPTAAISAEDVINTWSEAQLGTMLRDYGEERKWRYVAKRLIEERELRPIRTTTHLADVVGRAVGFKPPQRGKGGMRKQLHPATRAFQALRIAVNQELAVVEEALPAALASLAPGGRLAVISFHSLEDRIVKTLFRDAAGKEPMTLEELNNLRTWGKPPAEAAEPEGTILTSKPVVADEDEADTNPRSRSAKLRVFEKRGGPVAEEEAGAGRGRRGAGTRAGKAEYRSGDGETPRAPWQKEDDVSAPAAQR